jgi:hypothetical protein
MAILDTIKEVASIEQQIDNIKLVEADRGYGDSERACKVAA